MWAKLLLVVLVALAVLAGAYYMRGDEPEKGSRAAPGEQAQALKEAKDVVMYETRVDTDKTFVIHAKTVIQQSANSYRMEQYRMDRSDGMKIEGGFARYDTGKSRIDFVGPMTIETRDGWKAELSDLAWNRKSGRAATDRPVRVQGREGNIRADRADFYNDFKHIRLTGNVHAQVGQKLLAD